MGCAGFPEIGPRTVKKVLRIKRDKFLGGKVIASYLHLGLVFHSQHEIVQEAHISAIHLLCPFRTS